MKLIYLANIRIPTEKAHGLQIMKACETFADLGWAVELIVPYRRNPIIESPFAYYSVRENFKLTTVFGWDFSESKWAGKITFHLRALVFSLVATLRLLGKTRKDVVFYSRDFVPLFFLCLIGWRPVAEIHDYRLHKPRRMVRFILSHASRLIVNSTGTLEKIRQHYVFDEHKAKVVPNGVDPAFFNITTSPAEARKTLKITSSKKIVAYIGRIETAGVDKGVDLLLAAFKLLDQFKSEALFYVIGGPNELAREYQTQMAKLGFGPERIKFIGHVTYRQIPLYLRAVDLVVIPLPAGRHAATTSPIKLFEFLAAGKTIIAPRFPAFETYLDDTSALFFKPDDAADLAAKISVALNQPELAADLAAAARQLAAKFTWTNRAQQIVNFL